MMSAFEVKVTPTRCKNKKLAESREPTEVVMAPFSGKSIVLFEGVPVTKTARRILRIINPSEDDIKVSVCKAIKPEHNLNLEWIERSVPAQNEITMELVWSPQIDISCKETLQLIDNRNFRKDVMILLKSQPNKQIKNVRKYPTISSSNNNSHVKTLRLKSPTNAANKAVRASHHQHHTHKHQQQQQQQQKKRLSSLESSSRKAQVAIVKETKAAQPNLLSSNPPPVSNQQSAIVSNQLTSVKPTRDNVGKLKVNVQAAFTSPLMERNIYANEKDHLNTNPSSHVLGENVDLKENISPMALSNVLDIIDEMKFTPATATLSKPTQSRLEQLSLFVNSPMPGHAADGLRSDLKPRRLTADLNEDEDTEQANSKEDLDNETKCTTTFVTNKTFDVKQCESLENSIEILNNSNSLSDGRLSNTGMPLNKTTVICTTPISRPLEIIKEEENFSPSSTSPASLRSPKSAIDEDLKRDIKLVGTPLRKYSESMKDLYHKSPQPVLQQGSLPNLNEMETIKSIEQNRYFNQSNGSRKNVNVNVSVSKTQLHSQLRDITGSEQATQDGINHSEDMLNSSQASVTSQPDLHFNQSEILAQSSRFNLNEVGLKYRKNSPVVNKTKQTNHKNVPSSPKTARGKLNTVPEKPGHKRRCQDLSFSDSQSVDSIVSSCSAKTSSTKASSTTVSPPKRQRLDNRSPSVSAASSSKVKSWAQTQPKKFKLTRTLSLLKKPITPRKIKDGQRTRLYDCELFLQPYINPDPFAATTTCDPFLASTMYLDEEAVDRHQTDFKKWLNALVTMPADLDTDSNAKIDVGKLFNEVRHKELILAPTKEQQSINYLTNFRLESLRKAAVQLFLSEEMRGPCSKVAVYVQKNALRIRSDRNLHLDVVTQREILELLLCINPLWLRLGLEVVYGEKIHLQSNGDIVGLSSFILNRFFRDKFLEQKYSKAYTLSAEYAEHIKKFTLQKFFFLLLFLDKAKEKRIITHNPCLFHKKSPHKETREILLRFSSELLANIGDITRELKRLGYVLSHKQNYIDEFDYAFNNIAVDLRDGIRLTRVMEIILLRDDLTKQLRVPAISRLQRIFNVNLGLKALSEAEFELKGDIAANDIVDGHREKSLSLLWQIIYKFRSPKFHAAANVLQKWWRNSWLKVEIQRRIRHKEQLKREAAAITIQRAYRGLIARRYAAQYKLERSKAAIVLQKFCRRYLARKKFIHSLNCIVIIQKWLRAKNCGRQYRLRYKQIRQSTICIQRHWRLRRDARALRELAALNKCKYYQQRTKAAVLIQSVWRSHKAKRHYCKVVSSILVIQRLFRAKRKMREEHLYYQQLKKSAVFVQTKFRAKKLMTEERQRYNELRSKVIYLQRTYRAIVLMRQKRMEYFKIRQKIILIQQKWRATLLARKVRVEFIAVQYYATVIQQKFRATKQMQYDQAKYQVLRTHVIYIQQRFRAKLEMRRQYCLFQAKLKAVRTIQGRFLAHKAMRYQRAKYQGTKAAVQCIQEHFKNYLKMKHDRKYFLTVKSAVITIQMAYRLRNIMKQKKREYGQLRNSAICIQRRYRDLLAMRAQRKEYLRERSIIIRIQLRYKATLLARKVRSEYLHTRSLIIQIQRRFRANQLMLLEQKKYEQVRAKVICIQTHFRNYIIMKHKQQYFEEKRSAVLKIQSWYRSVLKMKNAKESYQRVRQSSLIIQRRYRALLTMRAQRKEYLRQRSIIIRIQLHCKATLLARKVRLEYLHTRSLIIKIQRRFRANQLMRLEQKRYEQVRAKVICIQTHFRNYIIMKHQQQYFEEKRSAVLKIQSWYRSVLKMRSAKESYQLVRQSSLTIQRKWKATLIARESRQLFLHTVQKVIHIQRAVRSTLQMRRERAHYLEQKQAAIILQRRYRAQKEMLKIRSQYQLIRSLVICIQRQYRAKRKMLKVRYDFVVLRKTTIHLQQKFRGRLKMREDREHFLQLKDNIVDFQANARGLLARRRLQALMTPEMKELMRQKKAVKIIQRFWRGYRIRKRLHNNRIQKIRKNIALLKESTSVTNSIRFKVQDAVRILKGRFSGAEALNVLMRLDRISRTVPHLLMCRSDFISTFCYGIMAQAIRSEVDKQIIMYCSRIILNLARYNSTTANTFQEGGLVTIAQMLLRWCDKDCEIFNTLCTLIWIFTHCPVKCKIIRDFMTTTDAIYMVRETKKLVARKEKMKQNVRKPVVPQQHRGVGTLQPNFSSRALPSLNPDYGVLRNKPYTFISSVYAFDTILYKLGIDIF